MIDLGVVPGDRYSTASAINDRGEIIGVSASQYDHHGDFADPDAFVWQRGKMRRLGSSSGGRMSFVLDINERGQIIGAGWTARTSFAFLWQSGKLTDLGTLPGGESCDPSAINDRGQVVGSCPTRVGYTAPSSGPPDEQLRPPLGQAVCLNPARTAA